MNTTSSIRRLAVVAAGAAIIVMGVGTVAANAVVAPLAPGPSGGEVTRGNQSGSFAPTSTNDLMTPMTPAPGSPWRD